jgi:hypothetical protein
LRNFSLDVSPIVRWIEPTLRFALYLDATRPYNGDDVTGVNIALGTFPAAQCARCPAGVGDEELLTSAVY